MLISRMKLWKTLIIFASAEMLYSQQHSTRRKIIPQEEAPLLSNSNLNVYRRFKRDSSGFLFEDYIPLDFAHSIQTRASNDSLKSAVDRLQKIARILNGISLQQGLITGSVPSDELISELLFFGSVTPSGIAKLDSEKIESAINALNNLPNTLTPTDVVKKVEKALNGLAGIKKAVDGAGNLTEWNSSHFKNEIEKLQIDGINSKFIKALTKGISSWQDDYENVKTGDSTISTFADIRTALEKIKKAISTVGQSLPLWTFNGFDTVMDGISPLTKIAEGVKLFDNQSAYLKFSEPDNQKYIDFVRLAVKDIIGISDLDVSLKDIKEVVAMRERRPRQRNLRHTHGFSRGSSDVSQMMIDVSDQWVKDVLKTDGVRIAFKQFEELIGLLTGLDRSIDFTGKGSDHINQFLAYIDHFADVMRVAELETALPENLECKITAINSPGADKFNELKRSLEGIDDKLDNLKNQTDLLEKALSTPGLSEMCDDVIRICEGKDVSTMINQFRSYEKLSQLNKVMKDMDDLVLKIKPLISGITNEANASISEMAVLDEYLKDHLPYAEYFTCLQNQKKLDSVFEVIGGIQEIRKFKDDQSFLNSIKNGLEVVKKVIESKDGLNTLKTAVDRMKGFQSPETLALKDLKNINTHSQIIGSSVEGISNMENALKQKAAVSKILENIQVVKVNQKWIVDPEDLENFNALIALEPVIQKMYQSLDQFSGVVEDSESPSLQNHSKIFKQAEFVTGITGNFLKMSTSIGKLKEKTTDPGDSQKLEEVESSLKTMNSMGLDFSAYQKSFKESSISLEAVDVMFASLPTKLATVPPPAIQQMQLWKKEDSAKIIMDLIMDNLVFVGIVLCVVLVLALLIVIIIMYFRCRSRLRKTVRLILCCSTRKKKTQMQLFEKLVRSLLDSVYKSIGGYLSIENFLEENPGEDFYIYAFKHFNKLFDEDDGATSHANTKKRNVKKELFTRPNCQPLYDKYRVRLSQKGYGKRFENDFYYSTMVKLPNGKRAVCAQLCSQYEPTDPYVKFWWMVKQLKSTSVVMTTPHKFGYKPIDEENDTRNDDIGSVLGTPFFPKKVGERMDILDLKLTCTGIEEPEEYKSANGEVGFPILKILVEFPNEEEFTVDLYWHRHCFQLDVKTLNIKDGIIGDFNHNAKPMIRTIKMIQSSKTPPVLCSFDGVNHVGIPLYVDKLLDILKEDDPFVLKGTLHKIREYNPGFVTIQQEFSYSLYILMEYLAEGLVITDPFVKDVYERLKGSFQSFMDLSIQNANNENVCVIYKTR